MTDEFLIFLVAGLVILAVLVAIANVSFVTQPIQTIKIPIITEITEESNDLRLVGLHGEGAARIDTLELMLGTDEFSQNLGNKRLYSGVLFGDDEFIFEITENTDTLEISFKVVSTNRLAPLAIRMSGEIIEKRIFNIGEYSFTINGPIESGTIIEIVPESSTWKIWAPAVYELKDIEFSTKSFARQKQELTLDLIDEYDFFKEARIEIEAESSFGTVDIEINDEVVYSGPLQEISNIHFGKDKLQRGQNSLVFTADEDSIAIGSANLIIFFDEQIEQELVLPFTITKAEHEEMRRGTIAFDIVDIQRQGGFSVKIKAGDEVLLNEFASVEQSHFTVYFNREDVRPGVNNVVIHQLEGSSFSVRNIGVQIS